MNIGKTSACDSRSWRDRDSRQIATSQNIRVERFRPTDNIDSDDNINATEKQWSSLEAD